MHVIITGLLFLGFSSHVYATNCLTTSEGQLETMIAENDFGVLRPFYGAERSYEFLLNLNIAKKHSIPRKEIVAPEFGIEDYTAAYRKVAHLELVDRIALEGVGLIGDLGAGIGRAMNEVLTKCTSCEGVAFSLARPTLAQLSTSRYEKRDAWHIKAVNELLEINSRKLIEHGQRFEYKEMNLDIADYVHHTPFDALMDVLGWGTYTTRPKKYAEFVYKNLRAESEKSALHLARGIGTFYVYVGEGVPQSFGQAPRYYIDHPQYVDFLTFYETYVKGLKISHFHRNLSTGESSSTIKFL